MPHFHIDYSPNLAERLDIAGFCEVVRLAAIQTGLFPLAGIRIRAMAADHVSMADGDPQHAYLDMSIRLREGRGQEAKEKAVAQIFAAAEAYCADVLESSSFMLSMEMRDIDASLSPKTSSIRNYVEEDQP